MRFNNALFAGAFFSTTTEAAPVVATTEMIETLLRAEGSPFCKAVAEVMRISREGKGES